MKTVISLLMLFISLSSCRPKTANLDLAETQVNFLGKLKQAEGLISQAEDDPIKRTQIIAELDNYLVDSVRQFKGWRFRVETVNTITLSGTPSYRIDLNCPVPGDSTDVTDSAKYVQFQFTIPKNPTESDLIELEKVTSTLSPDDIVEMNGVIFMTDPTMEIITLADYFDPAKPRKLYLIPVKLEKKSQ